MGGVLFPSPSFFLLRINQVAKPASLITTMRNFLLDVTRFLVFRPRLGDLTVVQSRDIRSDGGDGAV